MSGVNMVVLLGNLGNDPEVRFTQGKTAVANFRMATSESWKDKDGQKQERVEWHRIVVWGKLAELCGEFIEKGRQVHVVGRLQTRKWTDKENHDQYTTEVVATAVTFVGAKPSGSRRPEPDAGDFGEPPPGAVPPSGANRTGPDEDIPF